MHRRYLDLARTCSYGVGYAFSRLSGGRFESVQTFCAFVGQPRSGHTFLGALVDAHPDACIATEADALEMVARGYDRDAIFAALILQSRFVAHFLENRSVGYSYRVPGGAQGRSDEPRVIGDKMGRRTLKRLTRDPSLAEALRATTGVPLKLIHVVRNPFDSITTMCRRHDGATSAHRPEELEPLLRRAIDAYLDTTGLMRTLGSRSDLDILDVHHERFIEAPEAELRRVVDHVGLHADACYLQACASITLAEPRRTRFSLAWPPRLREEVQNAISQVPFLKRYRFDS